MPNQKKDSLVIELDIEGRRLHLSQQAREAVGFWVCELEESEVEPFMVGSIRITGSVESLLRETRNSLYSFVSSSWIDEHWVEEVAPKIKTYIQEQMP